MRCRDARKLLTAYLDSEVMASERTSLEAHLAGCVLCEEERSALVSSRRRVTDSLEAMAAEAAPSPQAWSHLQAVITEEVRTPCAHRAHWEGDHRMKMRWRIASAALGAVLIAVCVIGVVPSARAAAGEFFASVFSIGGEDPPLKLDYLPEDFDSRPLYQSGVFAADIEPDASGMVSAPLEEKEALYRGGDRLLLVRTSTKMEGPLPEGLMVEVSGHPAVLRTGLSGEIEGHGTDLDDAGLGSDEEVTGWVSGGTDGETRKWWESGSSAQIPSAHYENANVLTWDAGDTRVEILTNLPVEELMKVAEGVDPDD
ncbi:MAG: zf-HC2 domain-containing protein [Thermoleophilia bacterium]|nr:zf-HC2 domain-containing protein [Thermoleophilia bacterium]